METHCISGNVKVIAWGPLLHIATVCQLSPVLSPNRFDFRWQSFISQHLYLEILLCVFKKICFQFLFTTISCMMFMCINVTACM